MYIIFIIAMITLGIIILAADYKTEWSRYLSGIFFMGALSGLSDELNMSVIPFIKSNLTVATSTIDAINRLNGILTNFCEHIGIFLVVMYCVSYSGLLKSSKKLIVTLGVFSVAVFSYFIHPWLTTEEMIAANLYRKYYTDISLWGAPMLIAGLIMLFIAYFKERNPGIIRQRLVNLLLATPLIISGTLNLLILKAIGSNIYFSRINLTVIMAVIVIFLIFAVRNGAFGIRIRFDRQSVIESIDNIAEGTSIFNHTLKNEVSKLSIASRNLMNIYGIDKPDSDRYSSNIGVIENSISNLNVMINRMQNFSGDINLEESVHNVKNIIDKAVANVSLFLTEQNISLVKAYSFDIEVLCDENHLVESLTNILKNSCEALKCGGKIKIEVYGNRNVLYISISDNGPGIKKEYVSRVFEPFFTTKEGGRNFGFGLSYAYKVLNKHKGDLDFYSKENIGTAVVLSLPGSRIKRFDKTLPQRSK